ncbi:acyl carrier protein [Fructilactobacillus fructivorans]|uniref:Acyl carrier protein n=1 Tax=Fructilactobacillus fructivorans TaxID=1614 RepID=A0A0C1LZ66_9LACO|nr:acyl carrier protein [Fructilactobacillus fructivorans]KID42165.1 Acyl carrier protein [Fructilactobacillus fructivorans]MCT0152058.1 acyl carrier protein [Fructilactobacillus fructivorans]MCT2867950.1 acyl carrier protein [Fructilactobacillus fructivorans]MCT2868468.1 acyl carrier protein [Fructilactobacillus fructivorans]MCT2873468.1 acyl carrier protein [Fructilactobacillus fructivorans]
MDREIVFKKVAEITSNRFKVPVDKVTDDLNFTNDLGADFIDMAGFIVELEDEFGDVFTSENTENISDVSDLVDVIIRDTDPKSKKHISKK